MGGKKPAHEPLIINDSKTTEKPLMIKNQQSGRMFKRTYLKVKWLYFTYDSVLPSTVGEAALLDEFIHLLL